MFAFLCVSVFIIFFFSEGDGCIVVLLKYYIKTVFIKDPEKWYRGNKSGGHIFLSLSVNEE